MSSAAVSFAYVPVIAEALASELKGATERSRRSPSGPGRMKELQRTGCRDGMGRAESTSSF